ncbi:uncharacterized protein FOMMEDRAFT_144982 [Fomitiporia mediterranea MF3/22]|uniref:uncharacterized protein n=1 Tax=Fomitiporia mediterranea (strain MF3/22) TaxID=694068 RepID=UPI0004407590|nr:uncharacterized protein FOMMEDRAFT_144982 [Fomitiporia mediterranea MF3/22]EJD05417.1 hypothetical protein FOMMEDRAFT_144982 [Fomitiporia mediterranea MF3/22]
MFARTAFVLAALAASASAQLKILSPGGPNLWWVANSQNVIAWNCKESQVQNFTILLTNSNPNILVAPQAIIAVQQNFDCSRTLTTQQANLQVSTGYKLQFANSINSTQVYAESDEFEVKAQGSAYPDPSSTPSADDTSTSSGSATGSAAAPSGSNAAVAQMSMPGAFGVLAAGAMAMLAM